MSIGRSTSLVPSLFGVKALGNVDVFGHVEEVNQDTVSSYTSFRGGNGYEILNIVLR